MNILDSLIQSTNQINKQGQSNQLINLINQERLRIRLAHHSRDFGLVWIGLSFPTPVFSMGNLACWRMLLIILQTVHSVTYCINLLCYGEWGSGSGLRRSGLGYRISRDVFTKPLKFAKSVRRCNYLVTGGRKYFW